MWVWSRFLFGRSLGPIYQQSSYKAWLPPLPSVASEGRESENAIPAHSQHLDPETQCYVRGTYYEPFGSMLKWTVQWDESKTLLIVSKWVIFKLWDSDWAYWVSLFHVVDWGKCRVKYPACFCVGSNLSWLYKVNQDSWLLRVLTEC